MGNVLTLKTVSIKYTSFDVKPNYILNVEIDELSQNNLPTIREKIINLNTKFTNKKIEDIMYVLQHYLNTEKPKTLSQTDYYLFNSYNIPALEIKNMNAKTIQKINGYNTKKYYCFVCKLDKL